MIVIPNISASEIQTLPQQQHLNNLESLSSQRDDSSPLCTDAQCRQSDVQLLGLQSVSKRLTVMLAPAIGGNYLHAGAARNNECLSGTGTELESGQPGGFKKGLSNIAPHT